MEVTMISRGVEISIAEGVAETEDGVAETEDVSRAGSFSFFLFYF